MFFRKKKPALMAYATGKLISIEKVEDDVFSQKMMGDGVAIIPNKGEIYAPCDGEVVVVFEPTLHAVGIKMSNGMEVLLHVGLDTVNIEEKVFNCNVKVGDRVHAGDLLIQYDQGQLKSLGYTDVTMCVITNPGDAKDIVLMEEKDVTAKADQIVTYK